MTATAPTPAQQADLALFRHGFRATRPSPPVSHADSPTISTNIAVHGVDHLAHIVKQRLRACQQQGDLIAGFLAHAGMTLEPELPQGRGPRPSTSGTCTNSLLRWCLAGAVSTVW
jgi:hypothetical protein